ncbi:MAG: Asp-tRNA(Asn)/Glu-tRNA(Gln) amidotransferase subunit GatA [Alphaproteobacteria bacterium]|nr:Asp-tRNA(Asn)/Glu-tRNA(Gln) amidotransferase subunit GatA [Alphaproteobacteria bacterium]
MKLFDLSISEALQGLKKKDFSVTELTQAHLNRMEAHRKLNAYITETPERALKDAKESEKHYGKGTARPLEGIPFAHKDLFCTKGIPTTAGSDILRTFVPPYESTVSQKFIEAGTCLLGKVNLDQFGMGATCRNTVFEPSVNPYTRTGDPTPLVAGGSSGGSASAVAGGLAMGATTTDTGGSSRVPASYCGLVGLKTSYGRLSRYGCIAYASSFDTPSLIARNVKDTALLFENSAGHDPKDSTSAPMDVPNFSNNINPSVKGLKIGLIKEANVPGLSAEVKERWDHYAKQLEDAGAEIIEVSLPHLPYALASYYLLTMAEASANLARYDGVRYGHRSKDAQDLEEMYKKSRAEGFRDETKRRILIGTYVLSAGYYDAYYMKAAKVRHLVAQDYQKAFEKVDAILMPTTTNGAFDLDKELTPLEDYATDIYMVTASLAGICAMAVPVGYSQEGLPLSLQIQAKQYNEHMLFNVGQAIETMAPPMKKPSEIL